MARRECGHWKLLTEASWLWLIVLICLSGRCIGRTYDGFGYSVSGSEITITNYTGAGGAVTIPSSIPGVNGTVNFIGDFALWACADLTGVTAPGSVTICGKRLRPFCCGQLFDRDYVETMIATKV